jgi:2-methylisocitrate lyase-like PEP mutase family enzyme
LDTLSTKLAHRAGFSMAFVSGYSVSATAISEPDMGLLTQTELIDRAQRICLSVPIPVIVDADTGYGNPLNVHRTVAARSPPGPPAASWRTRSGRSDAATCAASG